MTAVARKGRRPGDRYALGAIVLHWLIAALILLQIILSSRMEGRSPEAFAIVQLHKSVGVTVLLLSLARLGWRIANPPPPMPPTMARWEKTLAAVTHVGFYGVMIGMPLTGWIMVSTSRFDIPTMLYGVVPWPHIPGLAGLGADAKEAWHEFGEGGHDLIIKGFYGLIALHVAGALKHQLFSRDEPVLSRMAPGAKAGRWLEPRIAVIALAALAVIAFGLMVQPPLSAASAPARAAEPADPADAVPANLAAPAAAPIAADMAAAATAPPSSGPVKWLVDAKDSELEFETTWGGQEIDGEFKRWTAEISFSPEALEASRVRVSIDMTSAETGDAQRDQSLPSGDWFDAAKNPRAVFEATRFEKVGDDRYVARGQLTLRGVTKPVSLPFRLQIDGDKARVRGVTSLDRTAFGVGQGDWTSTDQIPAKVSVSVDLKATRGLIAAVESLRGGRLVILPTETVYGLAADAANPQAVAAIFEAKGRPRFNPLIAHVADQAAAERIAVFDDRAARLAQAFWPGPLTLVLPVRDTDAVCDLARAGLDTVAVRVPGHPAARALLAAFGGPVVAPSANRSGRPSPTTFADAMEETGSAVGAAVDGGPCEVGLESTVVAILDAPRLLRPGAVTRGEIEALIGPLAEADLDAKRSPGRLARHYSPEAPVRLDVTAPASNEAFLAFGPTTVETAFNLSPTGDLREAAANLFAFLRAADRTKPTAIAVAPIPLKGLGEAIHDRLKRAAGFVG